MSVEEEMNTRNDDRAGTKSVIITAKNEAGSNPEIPDCFLLHSSQFAMTDTLEITMMDAGYEKTTIWNTPSKIVNQKILSKFVLEF